MLAAAQEDCQSASSVGFAPRGGRIGVTRLVLTDFRNYRSVRLDLGPGLCAGPVVLTGANGAGKTNLLEAMSFLSPGRGLRNVRLSDIDRRDGGVPPEAPATGWAVAATVTTGRGLLSIGTGRVGPRRAGGADNGGPAEPGGERRTIRIDGEPARGQAVLAERLGVLWLTPAM